MPYAIRSGSLFTFDSRFSTLKYVIGILAKRESIVCQICSAYGKQNLFQTPFKNISQQIMLGSDRQAKFYDMAKRKNIFCE